MGTNEIATKADIQEMKTEILAALGELMSHPRNAAKKWLRSSEVMEMLGLSSSGLQNLRVRGTLSFTKLGGKILYDYQDILMILESNKRNNPA